MQRGKKDSSIYASIIVPSYKEVANIRPLVERVTAAVSQHEKQPNATIKRDNFEIIYVDDNSRDGTEDEVKKLTAEGYPVRIIVRTTERGLSSAVLRGFKEAKGEILMCMDADLQHPPEKAPELLEMLSSKQSIDFVIGTRYGEGVAIDENWPMYRRVISKTARLMSRPLTPLSDPMTGFFGLRREVFERGQQINPIGFKIALELYVKCACKRAGEVPFSFGVRTYGESKLSGAVILRYLEQLWELYQYRFPNFKLFLIVLFIFALVLAYLVLSRVAQYIR